METWRRNLYLLWICNFMIMAGFSLIMPFLPFYVAELGVGGEEAVQMWSGLIYAVNFAVMAVVSPLWGAMADRSGRRVQMLRSGFGMAVTVALMGLATSVWDLVWLRVLQGVFSGFIPASVAFTAANTPAQFTGHALGLLQAGGSAGSIVGPLLGGVLAKMLGTYRPIFFLTGLSCLIAAGLVMLMVREDFTPPPASARSRGILAGFGDLAGNRILQALFVVYFFNFFAVMTVEPVLSLFLRKLDTPAEWVDLAAGAIFSASGVANVLTAPIFGRRGDRIGHRRIMVACLSASAVLYLLQSFVTAAWHLLLLRFLLGATMGGILPSAAALISRSSDKETQGRVFGLTNIAIFLGMVVGPLTGGAIAAAWGQRMVFAVTALAVAANLWWVWRMVPEDRPPSAEANASGTEPLTEVQ